MNFFQNKNYIDWIRCKMADILDQPDNDIDLYGDGELDTRFSERDVLGDDDDDITK